MRGPRSRAGTRKGWAFIDEEDRPTWAMWQLGSRKRAGDDPSVSVVGMP